MRDGGIIRFNKYVCDADTYTGKGGLNEVRTSKLMKESADYMVKTYPQFAEYKKCKSKYQEIRLNRTAKNII
jgi:hypothetical protein